MSNLTLKSSTALVVAISIFSTAICSTVSAHPAEGEEEEQVATTRKPKKKVECKKEKEKDSPSAVKKHFDLLPPEVTEHMLLFMPEQLLTLVKKQKWVEKDVVNSVIDLRNPFRISPETMKSGTKTTFKHLLVKGTFEAADIKDWKQRGFETLSVQLPNFDAVENIGIALRDKQAEWGNTPVRILVTQPFSSWGDKRAALFHELGVKGLKQVTNDQNHWSRVLDNRLYAQYDYTQGRKPNRVTEFYDAHPHLFFDFSILPLMHRLFGNTIQFCDEFFQRIEKVLHVLSFRSQEDQKKIGAVTHHLVKLLHIPFLHCLSQTSSLISAQPRLKPVYLTSKASSQADQVLLEEVMGLSAEDLEDFVQNSRYTLFKAAEWDHYSETLMPPAEAESQSTSKQQYTRDDISPIQVLQGIPLKERDSVIESFNTCVAPDTTNLQRIFLLKELAKRSPKNRKRYAQKVKPLLSLGLDIPIGKLVKALRHTPQEEWMPILRLTKEQFDTKFIKYLSSEIQLAIVKAIRNIPKKERKEVISLARGLYPSEEGVTGAEDDRYDNLSMGGFSFIFSCVQGRRFIIETITSIDRSERRSVLKLAQTLYDAQAEPMYKDQIIRALAEVPAPDRKFVAKWARKLFPSYVSPELFNLIYRLPKKNRKSILKELVKEKHRTRGSVQKALTEHINAKKKTKD